MNSHRFDTNPATHPNHRQIVPAPAVELIGVPQWAASLTTGHYTAALQPLFRQDAALERRNYEPQNPVANAPVCLLALGECQ